MRLGEHMIRLRKTHGEGAFVMLEGEIAYVPAKGTIVRVMNDVEFCATVTRFLNGVYNSYKDIEQIQKEG